MRASGHLVCLEAFGLFAGAEGPAVLPPARVTQADVVDRATLRQSLADRHLIALPGWALDRPFVSIGPAGTFALDRPSGAAVRVALSPFRDCGLRPDAPGAHHGGRLGEVVVLGGELGGPLPAHPEHAPDFGQAH